jgi:beta-ureidopropionase / N-carbamoyl-L-amino-acid hydrolase
VGARHGAHDLATVAPAAMIFEPCQDRVSHNEFEDATQADCITGTNVLMHTVLARRRRISKTHQHLEVFLARSFC